MGDGICPDLRHAGVQVAGHQVLEVDADVLLKQVEVRGRTYKEKAL